MGEALSFPEGTDGHAKDSSTCSAGGAASVPNEGVLLSQLIQLLSQRQRHSLLLSDLGALLPGPLRQRVKDQGGLRSWLQRYPSLFSVAGQPGKESVTLILGGASVPGGPDPGQAAPTESTAPSGTPAVPSTTPAPGTEAIQASSVFDEETHGHCAVQLRGLPYRATIEDVRGFLGDYATKLADENAIHLVLNRDGRPSGFARVQFTSPEVAKQCQDDLHLRSMDDRYVEVFLYSERPSRGRQRRGTEDGATVPSSGDAAGGGRGPGSLDVPAASREQVVKECRAEMAEPKNRRLLLSMLGVALSPGARSYLKQMDQGLKHFLAQFPGEFSVEGGKGCEYVTYTPTINLSEAIDGFSSGTGATGASAPSFQRAVGSSAPPPRADDLPMSPKPAKTPPTDPTPSAARGLATPSDWGTPSAATSAPWLPPWPSVAGSGLPNGSGESTATWGAPPAWPMPPPQFWPGWPPAMYPWGAAAASEVGCHQSLGIGATAAYAATSHVDAQGPFNAADLSAGGSSVLQASFAAAGMTGGDDSAGAGASPALAAAVRLRGLPFTASEQDVLAFFAQHDIVDRITDGPKAVNLLLRSNGRPSGQAVVQMRDRADAELAQQVLHGQWMGSRYIEVFLYGEDGAEGGGGAGAAATAPADTGGLAAVQAVGPPPPVVPPWLVAPWGSMPPALQGGPLAEPDATETSWQALFEFLGPEGMAAAAAVVGAGATEGTLPVAGNASVPSPVSAVASSRSA
mmetsp:Transcript_82799/g.229913  ORF Transcript_82799/g.229913 Transcript_82799/m.229913 type:complete len:743 (+) Transcript_82799:78-2306(+)